jgi:hypothetical protein
MAAFLIRSKLEMRITDMHYLYKFERNWADEFDVYGFAIFGEAEHAAIQAYIEKYADYRINYCFGTNEEFEEDSLKDFMQNYTIVEMDFSGGDFVNDIRRMLCGRDGSYGNFPDPRKIVMFEDDDDE